MEIANSMAENIPQPLHEFCQKLFAEPIALWYQCARRPGITLWEHFSFISGWAQVGRPLPYPVVAYITCIFNSLHGVAHP